MQFTIGRALQNSYVVEDVLVSRHHCSIELNEGRWVIVDTVKLSEMGKERSVISVISEL